MAPTQWVHLYRAVHGRESRWPFEDVFSKFHHGPRSRVFGGIFELIPNELLRYTDRFEDASLAGEIRVTVTLKKMPLGTELNILQENLPDGLPVEACYLGWQESLRNLQRLVEPEITE